jgi:hypothetical protein
MLAVNHDDILSLSEDVVLHGIPDLDKYWAFNLETGEQYSLSETAHSLLLKFKAPSNVEEALRSFAGEYEISFEIASTDCIDLIGEYLSEKILIRRQQ